MKRTWHKWTVEEEDFLRRYYPDHGIVGTLEEYNKRYMNITKRALEHRVYDLGLKLTEKRYREKQLENGKKFCQKERRNIGYVNPDSGMIKTEDGWTRLGRLIGVPKGHYAIHLNNDVTDNRPENIAVITKRQSMKMTKYKFWSTNPDITQTGIMCCELEDAINSDR